MADRLPESFSHALARRAGHPWAGAPVVFFEETTSTNDVALELAGSGAVEGTAVVALAQTAGRGRRGRSWTSAPGAGIYFTIVLRPSAGGPAGRGAGASRLTLMAAVAMADAVQEVSGLSPQIKWPNDLVVDAGRDPVTGSWRRKKLGGILTEAAMSGGDVQHVVIGVGLNLQPTAYPPDVVATSILSETQALVEPGELFAACRAALARDYAAWTAGGAASVLERWRRRAPSSSGCPVRWLQDGRDLRGVTAGVDDEGALLIEGDDGRRYRVVAGEVEWA